MERLNITNFTLGFQSVTASGTCTWCSRESFAFAFHIVCVSSSTIRASSCMHVWMYVWWIDEWMDGLDKRGVLLCVHSEIANTHSWFFFFPGTPNLPRERHACSCFLLPSLPILGKTTPGLWMGAGEATGVTPSPNGVWFANQPFVHTLIVAYLRFFFLPRIFRFVCFCFLSCLNFPWQSGG